MKRKILLIVMTLLCAAFCALGISACGGESGKKLEFEISNDGTYYIFSGLGKVNKPEIVVPDVHNGKPVTAIGSWAFAGSSSLTSVTLPDSITSIGYHAFTNCKSLTEINIPEGVTNVGEDAFKDCEQIITKINGVQYVDGWVIDCDSSVTKVALKKGTRGIADAAFLICRNLKKITIPDSAITIGKDAFKNCASLTEITISDSVTHIGSKAFNGCTSLKEITIPDSITTINEFTFFDCTSLKNITISDKVTSVGKGTFKNCSSLTEITIPEGVTKINEGVFAGCSSLKNITIPESVTELGNVAFYGCNSLKSITISDKVISVGDRAFEECGNLTIFCEAAKKPDGWEDTWNSTARPVVWDCKNNGVADNGTVFTVVDGYNCVLHNGKATLVKKPEDLKGEVTVPEKLTYKDKLYTVTAIEEDAFRGCASITSVIIPDTVTDVGKGAFDECKALTLYCKAAQKPNGWLEGWNGGRPVVWDCNNNEVADDGYIYCAYVVSGLRFSLKDGSATVVEQPDTLRGSVEITDQISYKGVIYEVNLIDDYAFAGNTSIESVTLPVGITKIGSNAFDGCTSLTNINYKGTAAQWKNIEKEGYWNNNTGDYVINCTDGYLEK